MKNLAKKSSWLALLAFVSFAGGAAAATCTTNAGAGVWDATGTWSCGHVPTTTDDVVITRDISLSANYTIKSLTVNADATLDNNNKDLTLSGNAVINGTYDATGNNGKLIMIGNGTTLSGNGTIKDIDRIQIDANVTIPTTSNLKLTLRSEIRVGDNSAATLTVNGTITGTGMNNGTRLIRADNNNTSSVIINGVINAPNSYIEVQSGGTVTNNGTVTLQYIDGDNAGSATWTQGANSSLTLTKPAVNWSGTFNASATGNTVTFNGTATPFNPVTYYNIAGTSVACPHPAGITVLGSTPCVTFPTVTSINTANANPAAPGSGISWTITFSASVTGVDVADFALVQGGGLSGASITSVTGGGTTWTVLANAGTGTGTLGLNLVDNDSIVDGSARKLGGTGAGNGNFTGQVYTVSTPTLSNVINTYYPGTATVSAGATSITLGAAAGATTPIAIGDTVIIMQMQDASLNAANTDAYGDGAAGDLTGSGMTGVGGSGKYEYAIAASNVPLGGGTLTLACGTINAYTNAAAVAGSAGQKKYQVIRVPSYADATLTSTLTAGPWNGSAGGVLAIDVTGALTLGGATVTLDGKGFRGGAGRNSTTGAGANSDYRTATANLANGSKGEGIAGTPQYVFTAPATSTNTGVDGYPNGSFARGAPGNAGGGGTDLNPAANDRNSGGGGGGNGGAGGIGGIGWCPTFVTTAPYYGCGLAGLASATNLGGSSGGFGGSAVSGLGATRLTLGGGGGAATTNNATGTLGALSSSGAAGGGIFMLRAGSMSGTATINANGSAGDSTVGNDGSGGGGAGGIVMISAGSGMAGVTINVNGGKGGDNLVPGVGGTSNPHGPGGGGGGGYVITSAAPASCASTGGANGVTYRNGAAFGAYGAGAGSGGSCVTGLTAAQIPGTSAGATACGPSIDHYELSMPSNGVSCLPVTVTVTACSDNSSPCTSPITTINGKTATLGTSVGALGSATVTFNAAGTASTTLSYPAASNGASAVVTLSGEQSAATNPRQCCPDGASCAVANSCSATFNTTGFIFSASAGGAVASIPSQVAGVSDATYYLRAVKTNTTTKACESALSGASAVNFAYECNNPTACYAANQMSVNGGTLTPIARNNNGSVSSYASVNMTFDANGSAPFTFTYGDVGQVKLHASKVVGGTLLSALSGQSNAFVVKPYDFEVLPCAASVAGNCAVADVPADPGVGGGGAVFAKAGEPFKATVTARAFGGAATPSFGAGSNSGSETVDLTRTRVAPVGVGAVDGTLGGTTAIPRSSFSNGIATVSDLSWSEVGVITVTATNSTFLGNALTSTGSSGNIGRFYPDHFDTEVILASGVPMPCPTGLTCPALYDGFVYSGQDFTAQVTARNLSAGKTQNYDGALGYAKAVTLTAWDAKGSTAAQNPSAGSLGFGAITFSAGVANSLATKYSIASTTAPTDIYVRAKDADGVTSLRASSVEGGVKVASGRIKVGNAYGSEKLPLSVPVTVQFYDGSFWKTSTTDGVTALTLAGSHNIVKGATVTGTTTPAGMTAWLNGTRNIQLGKPTVGGTGNATIAPAAPSYLPVTSGTATFGIYKGGKEFIYLREAY